MAATFADVMRAELENRGTNRNRLYEELHDNGLRLSKSNWYAYLDGVSVPGISKAKEILNTLNISFNDSTLNAILDESSEARYKEKRYKDSRFIQTGVNLRITNLSNIYVSEDQIRFELNTRVKKTAENFSDYLTRLIREDLDKHILPEREESE